MEFLEERGLASREELEELEVAIDDGTEKAPIKIKGISFLMEGYFLLLTYE